MTRRMLDTNIIGYLMRKDRMIAMRLYQLPAREVCVSVVTEAEVRFGLAKRGSDTKFGTAVEAFFSTLEVLPWTRSTAAVYGHLRADFQRRGRLLAPLDMMIAAHAVEAGAILVTADRALLAAPGLACENWLAA